ncbi:MAG TPA: hypothetical protein VGD81_13155 [Opitutaceae bacterium]
MKRARSLLPALAACLVLGPTLAAQSVIDVAPASAPPDARVTPATPLRREALRLIREDAAAAPAPVAAGEAETPPLETAGEVVELAPFMVQEQKPPDFSTPRETPTQKFFRTGTVAERVGEKVTTQLWIRGDRGVMLSFRW